MKRATIRLHHYIHSHLLQCRLDSGPIYIFFWHDTVAQQTCVSTDGLVYNGNVAVTQQDKECQRWDSQYPHKHRYTDPSKFPDSTLADAGNYCRAPDGNHLPWCYTTSIDQCWEYCDFDMIYWGMQKRKIDYNLCFILISIIIRNHTHMELSI